mmetsp:Transcript_43220/g.94058  ORF Transcript_43220/g.94058 Transcript_43220/m.94058 type:complete len:259 (+) Transcript_43220:394-1170(+)
MLMMVHGVSFSSSQASAIPFASRVAFLMLSLDKSTCSQGGQPLESADDVCFLISASRFFCSPSLWSAMRFRSSSLAACSSFSCCIRRCRFETVASVSSLRSSSCSSWSNCSSCACVSSMPSLSFFFAAILLLTLFEIFLLRRLRPLAWALAIISSCSLVAFSAFWASSSDNRGFCSVLSGASASFLSFLPASSGGPSSSPPNTSGSPSSSRMGTALRTQLVSNRGRKGMYERGNRIIGRKSTLISLQVGSIHLPESTS